jgi:pyruvate kinase
VAFSELGSTARLISKQRPAAPIIAFTPFEPIRRQMALYWGVQPHTMQQIAQTDERIHEAERRLKAEGLVKPGERIVILSGTRIGQPGGTNFKKSSRAAVACSYRARHPPFGGNYGLTGFVDKLVHNFNLD